MTKKKGENSSPCHVHLITVFLFFRSRTNRHPTIGDAGKFENQIHFALSRANTRFGDDFARRGISSRRRCAAPRILIAHVVPLTLSLPFLPSRVPPIRVASAVRAQLLAETPRLRDGSLLFFFPSGRNVRPTFSTVGGRTFVGVCSPPRVRARGRSSSLRRREVRIRRAGLRLRVVTRAI